MELEDVVFGEERGVGDVEGTAGHLHTDLQHTSQVKLVGIEVNKNFMGVN